MSIITKNRSRSKSKSKSRSRSNNSKKNKLSDSKITASKSHAGSISKNKSKSKATSLTISSKSKAKSKAYSKAKSKAKSKSIWNTSINYSVKPDSFKKASSIIKNKSSARKQTIKSLLKSKSSKHSASDSANDFDIVIMERPSDSSNENVKRFYTKPKTAYHLSRPEFDNREKIIELIDDYMGEMNKGKKIGANIIKQKIFNHKDNNCICEHLASNKGWDISAKCNCENLEKLDNLDNLDNLDRRGEGKYSTKTSKKSKNKLLGRLKKTNYSINCNGVPHRLNVAKLGNYYIKKRAETGKYIFLEMDEFTTSTIIHKQLYKELPNNIMPLYNSGVCKKDKRTKTLFGKNYKGYNLLDPINHDTSFGNGQKFVNALLDGELDKYFEIDGESKKGRDYRYKLLVNFLLQSVCIIGHLQSSNLEFFHGNFKPEHVIVQHIDPKEFSHFHYTINDIPVEVRNLGIAVHLKEDALWGASLTLGAGYFSDTNKKYRIVPPLLSISVLLSTKSTANKIIEKYGDSDPRRSKGVEVKEFASGLFTIKSQKQTISTLQIAGVRQFRDFDIYTFFIMLINSSRIRNYIISHRIDDSIMSFMSIKFAKEYFKVAASKNININSAANLTLNLYNKLGESMPRVFTGNYIKSLDHLNLYLFDPK
jgi:hypothetical protein